MAAQFALRNQVPLDELQTIVDFIHSASGGGGSAPPAQQAQLPSPSQQAELMQKVMEMGFNVAQAKAALERASWNIEGALALLLS